MPFPVKSEGQSPTGRIAIPRWGQPLPEKAGKVGTRKRGHEPEVHVPYRGGNGKEGLFSLGFVPNEGCPSYLNTKRTVTVKVTGRGRPLTTNGS